MISALFEALLEAAAFVGLFAVVTLMGEGRRREAGALLIAGGVYAGLRLAFGIVRGRA
jgi:hypothetical protein